MNAIHWAAVNCRLDVALGISPLGKHPRAAPIVLQSECFASTVRAIAAADARDLIDKNSALIPSTTKRVTPMPCTE
jgi:hypothetical protein